MQKANRAAQQPYVASHQCIRTLRRHRSGHVNSFRLQNVNKHTSIHPVQPAWPKSSAYFLIGCIQVDVKL